MSVYKDSLQYAILGASAGALLLPLVDYLDNSITPLYYSAAIGAASGFVLGGGGLSFVVPREQPEIAPIRIATPHKAAVDTKPSDKTTNIYSLERTCQQINGCTGREIEAHLD